MASSIGPENATSLQARLKDLGILSPVDPRADSAWRAAPRLDMMSGKVGGFLGNRKANAALLLQGVQELLDKELEWGDSYLVEKYVYSRPASPDIVDDLASRCDFVVTAIAD